MLDRAKIIGGFKTGEYSAASGQTYQGGQPARMDTDGYLKLCTSDELSAATQFVGIFANSHLFDWAGSATASTNQLATIYVGPFACRLMTGTKDAYADTVPYATGDSWDEGSPLYVGADGLWTLTDPGNGVQRGVVMVVGDDYLDVIFNR